MAIRNPYPGIHAYVCESFHAFLVTPNPARRRCEYTVDDVAAAAEYRDAARYRYRTPLATPPPAEVDSVAASYPELTQPHSDELHGADVAYTFGGAVAHAAVATPAAAAAMPSRRYHAAGMETQAPEVEPETGDTVLHHPLQLRADVRYYSINHHLVPTRPNRNWRSLLPPGWHPRACPAWARLRVGQVSTSFSPEDVAIVIEGFAGVRVQHVEAQANGVGLFMVWVSRKDVLAVLSLARAFVCDREGVWAAPPGSGQLPRDICRDGVYREGVAKCPVTIEVPRGRDTMWD